MQDIRNVLIKRAPRCLCETNLEQRSNEGAKIRFSRGECEVKNEDDRSKEACGWSRIGRRAGSCVPLGPGQSHYRQSNMKAGQTEQ